MHAPIVTIINLVPDILAALPQIDLGGVASFIHTFQSNPPQPPAPSGPPIKADNMVKELAKWLLTILSAVGFLYLVIDMFKHVTASPRDLRGAGIDLVIMVVLLTIASRAEQTVSWLQSFLI